MACRGVHHTAIRRATTSARMNGSAMDGAGFGTVLSEVNEEKESQESSPAPRPAQKAPERLRPRGQRTHDFSGAIDAATLSRTAQSRARSAGFRREATAMAYVATAGPAGMPGHSGCRPFYGEPGGLS